MTIKLHLSSGELSLWKETAAHVGLSLSEWIRAKCNTVIVVGPSLTDTVRYIGPQGKPLRLKQPKTCVHGKEKGYNCWQCGGVARIGVEG